MRAFTIAVLLLPSTTWMESSLSAFQVGQIGTSFPSLSTPLAVIVISSHVQAPPVSAHVRAGHSVSQARYHFVQHISRCVLLLFRVHSQSRGAHGTWCSKHNG